MHVGGPEVRLTRPDARSRDMTVAGRLSTTQET
jgi:hypothetical protein